MSETDGLPRDPAELRLLLHALADGELDAASALALERRVAADPTLAEENDSIREIRGAVRQLPRPEVSASLLARVEALGGRSNKVLPSFAHPQRHQFEWRAMAASMLLSAMLAGSATYLWTAPRPSDLAAEIASTHRRSLLSTSPIDIASSDRHTVKPWLDAKVGMSPPATDLTNVGFTLVGGRIEVIDGRPVPALVYRHREHLISVVALPRGGETQTVLAPQDLSTNGFSMVRWSEGAFSYWAVTDMERSELDDFVGRFRTATAGS